MKRHITKIIYIASVVLYLLLAFELVGGIMSLNGYELSMDPEILSQNMSYFLAVILTFACASILLCLARLLDLLEERANGWWR